MAIGDELDKNIGKAKSFNQEIERGKDSFRDYTDILKSINEELGANYSTQKDARKEYDSLISLSKQLTNQEESLTRLSDEQLTKLQEKANINVANLQSLAEEVSKRGANNEAEKALLIGLESGFEVEQEILGKLEEQVANRKESNKLMGVAGGLLATLDGLLGPMSKALGLDQMKKDMQEVADRVAKYGS